MSRSAAVEEYFQPKVVQPADFMALATPASPDALEPLSVRNATAATTSTTAEAPRMPNSILRSPAADLFVAVRRLGAWTR